MKQVRLIILESVGDLVQTENLRELRGKLKVDFRVNHAFLHALVDDVGNKIYRNIIFEGYCKRKLSDSFSSVESSEHLREDLERYLLIYKSPRLILTYSQAVKKIARILEGRAKIIQI